MNWTPLNTAEQLETIKEESTQHPVLIFKHSTRCSISATSLRRLERSWNDADVPTLKTYFLDLIAHRAISNQIAQDFGVQHESPQVLLIRNGESVYDASHYDIAFEEIKAQTEQVVS